MAEQQEVSNQEGYSDISVKMRDIEEKQNILKDRILLIGENFISEKEGLQEELNEIKSKISLLTDDLKRLKMNVEMIIENMNNFTRRNEFDILKRQFTMFQPLELARISDVENMINEALKSKK